MYECFEAPLEIASSLHIVMEELYIFRTRDDDCKDETLWKIEKMQHMKVTNSWWIIQSRLHLFTYHNIHLNIRLLIIDRVDMTAIIINFHGSSLFVIARLRRESLKKGKRLSSEWGLYNWSNSFNTNCVTLC